MKEPTDPNPGTSAAWGAPDAVQCAQLIKGTYPGQAIPEAAIKNTAMTLGTSSQVITGAKIFNNTILQINNPALTFQYKVNSSAILANINVTLPLLVSDDTFVFANFVQTLTNKTIDGGSNSLANIASASIVTRLSSKDLADSTTISNVSATSKAIAFTLSGMTSSVVLTISSTQSTSQTLSIPNITGADTLVTTGLAQTIAGVKTYSGGITMSGSDITLAGNKIKTTTYQLFETVTVVNPILYYSPLSGNNPMNIGSSPSGTSKTNQFHFFRTSDVSTNYERMTMGSDLAIVGEFGIYVDKGNSGIIRPFNFYIQGTKLLSFDTANTVTNYVSTLFQAKITQYNNITTAGGGISAIYGTVGLGVSLATTATAITSYTPASTGFYSIRLAISCKTSETVTITISYVDPQAGTITNQQIYTKALTGGTTDSVTYNVYAASGTVISVSGTGSVLLGDAYASGQVEQLQ